jgi:hypothetical protein
MFDRSGVVMMELSPRIRYSLSGNHERPQHVSVPHEIDLIRWHQGDSFPVVCERNLCSSLQLREESRPLETWDRKLATRGHLILGGANQVKPSRATLFDGCCSIGRILPCLEERRGFVWEGIVPGISEKSVVSSSSSKRETRGGFQQVQNRFRT